MSEQTTKAIEWIVLVILIIIGVTLVPTVVDTVQTGMTQLTSEAVKMSYYPSAFTNITIYGAVWQALPFNMTKNCDLSNITLPMYRLNRTGCTPAGNVVVDLEYADATTGKPNNTIIVTAIPITAGSLASATYATNYTFVFAATHLYTGENYSIVVSAPDCNSTDYVKWMQYADSVYTSPYPAMASADSGATWAQDARLTFGFELYGVYNIVALNVMAIMLGLIPFIFIVGLIIYFLVRLLRD
jgi:hypothetical protein